MMESRELLISIMETTVGVYALGYAVQCIVRQRIDVYRDRRRLLD